MRLTVPSRPAWGAGQDFVARVDEGKVALRQGILVGRDNPAGSGVMAGDDDNAPDEFRRATVGGDTHQLEPLPRTVQCQHQDRCRNGFGPRIGRRHQEGLGMSVGCEPDPVGPVMHGSGGQRYAVTPRGSMVACTGSPPVADTT